MPFLARSQNVMGKFRVLIAIATPTDQREIEWMAAEGATIQDLLEDGFRDGSFPKELDGAAVGVWGERKALDYPLQAGDRIEFYRPLQFDPKEARRARAKKP
ncbi:MAG: RnfH family protein [Gammaproteobacteria bacterium]|nr:RnfH family protein [Gammaproteobacteria bacterium]